MLPHIILAFLSILISNVSSSFYIKSTAFGGNGGTSFDKHKFLTKGFVIRKLEVWQGKSMLRGIRITYSDGSTDQMGKLEEIYTSFELDYDNGERVIDLAVFNNYVYGIQSKDERCGAFKIMTNKGRTFFPQMTDRPLAWKFMQSPGGGIILGLHGKHGDDIDSLGFRMIRPIRSMVLRDISYNMQYMAQPVRRTYLDETIPNASPETIHFLAYEESMDIRRTGEWSISGAATFGLDFTISGVIPMIEATAEATASWDVSVTGQYRSSWVETLDATLRVPIICPPLSKTRFFYYWFEGTGSVTMSGTMYVTVDNGLSWIYPVTGTYNGVYETRIIGDSTKVAEWKNDRWILVKPV